MPLTRMIHEAHGNHICYTPEEVEAHERQGWRKYDYDKKNIITKQVVKKRGRPSKWQSQITQN